MNGDSSLIAVLAELSTWNWFIAAGILLVLELAAPGSVFLWFGLACLGTGLITLVFAIGWQVQAVIFGVLAVASLMAWYKTRRRYEKINSGDLNDRAARLIGKIFKLDEPIVNGKGRLKIDDSVWRIEGMDLAAGMSVRVISVDSSTLIVEAI